MKRLILNSLLIAILLVLFLAMYPGCKKNNLNYSIDSGIDTTSTQETPPDTAAANDDFKLTEYDTPPTPIQNPMPLYPVRFRNSGIQGVVVLEVNISDKGIVTGSKVVKSLLPEAGGLDDVAISTVKNWKFKPALLNKKPVNSKVTIPIPFNLKLNK
jgi:TonB family protein